MMPPTYAATLTLIALLLCGDLVFIAINAVHLWTPWLRGGTYSMETDRGPAELYQYIKQMWVVVCMGAAFLYTRKKMFVGWMGLFSFLLVDDAAQIHENVGFWLGRTLNFPALAGLRPDDFGEVTVAALVGGVTVSLIAPILWRGDRDSRLVACDILC